jgi:hypothetical protein
MMTTVPAGKVANIAGSDAAYGALPKIEPEMDSIATSHKYFVSKAPFPQQFGTISEKFPDVKRTNRVNDGQFLIRPDYPFLWCARANPRSSAFPWLQSRIAGADKIHGRR